MMVQRVLPGGAQLELIRADTEIFRTKGMNLVEAAPTVNPHPSLPSSTRGKGGGEVVKTYLYRTISSLFSGGWNNGEKDNKMELWSKYVSKNGLFMRSSSLSLFSSTSSSNNRENKPTRLDAAVVPYLSAHTITDQFSSSHLIAALPFFPISLSIVNEFVRYDRFVVVLLSSHIISFLYSILNRSSMKSSSEGEADEEGKQKHEEGDTKEGNINQLIDSFLLPPNCQCLLIEVAYGYIDEMCLDNSRCFIHYSRICSAFSKFTIDASDEEEGNGKQKGKE